MPISYSIENEGATTIAKVPPISYWIQTGNWPNKYFKTDSQTWTNLQAGREADMLAEELQRQREWDEKQIAFNDMAHPLLARKRSTVFLRGQNTAPGTDIQSDLPSEEKSAKYRNPAYETELEGHGSFMYESALDITEESKKLCQNLLNLAQTVVQDSLFRDDRFQTTCHKLHNENEAMIVQDITRLIVPSAKNLATCGAKVLEHLAVIALFPSRYPDHTLIIRWDSVSPRSQITSL